MAKKQKNPEVTFEEMESQLNSALEPAYIKKERSKKVMIIVYNLLFFIVIFSTIVILFTVQSAKEKGETPFFFNYCLLHVETGSMEPTYPVDTVLLAKKVKDTSALKVGDVVTFYNAKSERITHRIVEVIEHNGQIAYKTKGDNKLNSIDSDILMQDKIISIVIRVVG